jgi:peptidoglycan/xylan/chitin deacetylase (PgdA/CDA1 family)
VAQITDFWDFSGLTSISYEPRNFYDATHYRTSVGELMVAKMFSDTSIEVPEDFGAYVTKSTVDQHIATYPNFFEKPDILKELETNQSNVLRLMYHRVTQDVEESEYGTTVSTKKFEEDLSYLVSSGYTFITSVELNDYMNGKVNLPEKSVIITFDDGYYDNYLNAYPLLKKYNAKALFFPIGWSIGRDSFIKNNDPIIPHYSKDAMVEMSESGIIEFGSHTFDLHNQEGLSNGYETRVGYGIDRLVDESQETYYNRLYTDFKKAIEELESITKKPVNAFSFPYGRYNDTAVQVLKDLDVHVAFITSEDSGREFLNQYTLPRINATETITLEELLN